MTYRILAMSALTAVVHLVQATAVDAQGNNRNNGNQRTGNRQNQEEVTLPDDRRLLALHRRFVEDAEKLAGEYERDREFDKAKDVYGEILRLVPQYQSAQDKLTLLKQREASAMKEVITVHADRDWQSTGIVVQQGKPITINAEGSWTFTFRATLTPDGIQIPDVLKEFNLGSLVGYIDSGDPENQIPFEIGNGTSFVAENTGMLYLRMWDSKHQDNDGALTVTILGTFDK